MHINNLGLENFRVFEKQQWFDFSSISIITGTNSSGKSSIINALRLLQENYKFMGLPSVGSPEEFDITQLMRNEFDSEMILERFGNIAQFVNRNSNKNYFSFAFRVDAFKNVYSRSDDVLDLKYTISVQNNHSRNGKLSRIEIFSHNENAVIFDLFEKSDNGNYWALKINLVHYYSKYLDSIKYGVEKWQRIEHINKRLNELDGGFLDDEITQNLNELNRLFDNSYSIDFVDGKGDLQVSGMSTKFTIFKTEASLFNSNLEFYNYNELLKMPGTEKLKGIINERYGGLSGFENLTLEIFKFFSKIEWNDSDSADQYWKITDMNFIRWMARGRDLIPPVSLDYIVNLYHNRYSDETESVANYVEEIRKCYLFNKSLFSEIDVEAVLEFIGCSILNKDKYELVRSTTSNYLFYNNFLIGHLTQLLIPFKELNRITFLSAQRTLPKRINSILENDNLSKLVKELLLQPEKKYNEAIAFVNKWVKIFDIGEYIEIDKDYDTAQFKFYIHMRDGAKTLLADSGFGVLQVIPLILSSINTDKEYEFELNAHFYNKKVVVIEEPETNLHPALQSKLADMFFESATTFNIQFIIETHSEYLIRKFQYLTAKPGNNFYTDDTVIYYLSSNHELGGDEPRVRKININGDGTLTDDFGSGFFDEADKIALELFLLNKSQGN